MTASSHRTLTFVNWRLQPNRDDDAAPTTYSFRCLTLNDDDTECAEKSALSTDPTEPQLWVFAHLRTHPDHLSYAEVIERPWVMRTEGPA
ncbi:hypothetical protein [Streptomyces sp. NBC_01506]|uniref:DUF7848 domain-containing protein n=1 Tax=Streptomyces sp. NBC_01506 TaxID=2903887 RepID=UPI00386664BE